MKKVVLSVAVAMGLWATEIKAQSTESSNNPKEEIAMAENVKKGNKLIKNGVVAGFKLIENGVVSGYKAIENGVVSGYKVVEDKCVETLFQKDGETTEEAKIRLKNVANVSKAKKAEETKG
ncbi:hypothetical protein FACS189467_3090 [Bacteroidia bacterium]|nr:hypothetical protein FACS189467_3090 [Bacteroidia bacterium]